MRIVFKAPEQNTRVALLCFMFLVFLIPSNTLFLLYSRATGTLLSTSFCDFFFKDSLLWAIYENKTPLV